MSTREAFEKVFRQGFNRDADFAGDEWGYHDIRVDNAWDLWCAAIQHERERIVELIQTGQFCREADHVQGACDCAELAAAIRNREGK